MPRITLAIVLFCASAHAREIQVQPCWQNAPLEYDARIYELPSGQTVSVTRLDFLISDMELFRDGEWKALSERQFFISGRPGRTAIALPDNAPAERMRFRVGLNPEINNADAAAYPPGHALNPLVNGLHWSWLGGYIFLAMEGNHAKPDGEIGGYSYHLAGDHLAMPVEIELPPGDVRIVFNIDRILPGRIDEQNASTHSRSNDALAVVMAKRVSRAFSAEATKPVVIPLRDDHAMTHPVEPIPGKPYRFTFSSFFPRPKLPDDNPLTVEGVALGEKLFFDKRLSVNNAQSCADCHQPAHGFAEPRVVSEGAIGQPGKRNTPPVFNLAWRSSFGWDGNSSSLRDQILRPIEGYLEMSDTLTNVVQKLRSSGDYPDITSERLVAALEQFLLSLISDRSKFDRVLAGREQFTGEEQRGFELFHMEFDPAHGQMGGDCFHCHGGPLLKSQEFANNGLDRTFADAGRGAVTGKPGDQGKFAVPSLRNVALTAPYMHDGRLATLEDVMNHYSEGVQRSATLDPNIAKHPDGGVPLSAADRQAIIAFLKTLTDE